MVDLRPLSIDQAFRSVKEEEEKDSTLQFQSTHSNVEQSNKKMGNSASKATSAAKQATRSTRQAAMNQQPLAGSRSTPPKSTSSNQSKPPHASETKDEGKL